MKRSVILVILDGWGIGRDDESNPIYVVKPENIRWIENNFPATSLQASGINVGLPWGEVGNSEVGHLTMGAGRILYQYYPKITLAIKDQSFFANAVLKSTFAHAKKNTSAINFVGLLTKANVHASLDHLRALIAMAEREGVAFKMHLFADGKDSPPRSIEKFLKEIPLDKLATLIGRHYAMDREQNWHLTQKAYETLTDNGGQYVAPSELSAQIDRTCREDQTEEFLPPLRLMDDNYIQDNEAVVFFNFREDSIRQISESFILKDFDKFPIKNFKNLYIATMTKYEDKLDAPIVFPADIITEPLGKVLSESGKTQLRLAETYKYAHVTYFFNSHQEIPYKNEYRALIPSAATIHADEHPQMMASSITDRLLQAIDNQSFDFVLVNYANADTIGHTGNYNAALDAVRTIDKELGRILKSILNTPSVLLVTADHGNIEEIINPMTGQTETQHDPNPVPFYVVGQEFKGKKFVGSENLRESIGMLSDIAPTVLGLMGIKKPDEMTGHDLIQELLP